MTRSIAELLPTVQKAILAAKQRCDEAGLPLLITCTYRTEAEQAELYAQGRTKPGPKVTNARPGQSFHQYRVAVDLYPMIGMKPDFSGTHPNWHKIAEIMKSEGFEWGYEWKTFKEMPHFQMTKGHPLAYFQQGGTI